jgi:3-oxoacyl-[acyl-carrier protein] reductase
MDLGLEGKAAIVTGGASGIGAAVVAALARERCDVMIADRRPAAEATATLRTIEDAGRRALYFEADVRDADAADRAVREIVAQLGRLDILVCAAGIHDDAVAWKMSARQWDDVLAVNLTGCFHWNRAAAAVLKERGAGRIVNVSSINGLRGKFGQANYAASKGGMIALSKTMARELGRYGVTVNVVAPGMVRTEMTAQLRPEVVEAAIGETLLGRIAEPEDCAAAVAFLCSDRARHVTGQVVQVDGGQYL